MTNMVSAATRAVRRATILLAVGLLRAYKLLVSPLLPKACRFLPSCSVYAEEAFRRHGPLWGLALTLGRLARCHPFATGGTYDPVPVKPALRAILGSSDTFSPTGASTASAPEQTA